MHTSEIYKCREYINSLLIDSLEPWSDLQEEAFERGYDQGVEDMKSPYIESIYGFDEESE